MSVPQAANEKITLSWYLLKFTYATIFLLAGIDKFKNYMTFWPQYLNPLISAKLALSVEQLFYIIGIIEVTIGLMILSRWTREGALVGATWFVIIIFNLLSRFKFYDIAARDLGLAIGLIVLALLTEVRQSADTQS